MQRTVVVSGASRGIGLAISQSLIADGHSVIALARDFSHTGFKHKNFSTHCVDLGDSAQPDAELQSLLQERPVDALVSNAGRGRFGSLEQYSAQQIQHELQINLVSHILLCRFLVPYLKRLKRSDIVFIGSESALQGGRYGSIYSAAKFGLRGFAQALRHECANSNCHVGVVNPGMVRTDFFSELNFEPGDDDDNALLAEDVAAAVMQMLHSADRAVIDEINLNPLKKVIRKK